MEVRLEETSIRYQLLEAVTTLSDATVALGQASFLVRRAVQRLEAGQPPAGERCPTCGRPNSGSMSRLSLNASQHTAKI
jgi:hypothetical protein